MNRDQIQQLIQEAISPLAARIQALELENSHLRHIIDKGFNKQGSDYKNIEPTPISNKKIAESRQNHKNIQEKKPVHKKEEQSFKQIKKQSVKVLEQETKIIEKADNKSVKVPTPVAHKKQPVVSRPSLGSASGNRKVKNTPNQNEKLIDNGKKRPIKTNPSIINEKIESIQNPYVDEINADIEEEEVGKTVQKQEIQESKAKNHEPNKKMKPQMGKKVESLVDSKLKKDSIASGHAKESVTKSQHEQTKSQHQQHKMGQKNHKKKSKIISQSQLQEKNPKVQGVSNESPQEMKKQINKNLMEINKAEKNMQNVD